MNLKKYLLFLFTLILFSCSQNDDDIENPIDGIENPANNTDSPITNSKAGVVLTFDDNYVNEWYDLNTALKKYDWKATFFVSKFDELSPTEIQKLKALENDHHEIGGHSLKHLNAPFFVSENGADSYLNQEITPMLNLMNDNLFTITSFAYPYGARNPTCDNILLDKFKIIRGTTYDNSSPAYQNCYYNNNRLIFGLGIDNSYPHFSVSYFISLLEYAKKNNKIVIFYSHRPVQKVTAAYETEYQTLFSICEYVKSHKMKFYKTTELYGLSI